MANKSTTVVVGVTATQLANPTQGNVTDQVPCIVFNNDTATTMFIGGPDVTVANGLPVLAHTGVSWRLMLGEPLFGIVLANTIDCRVLLGRQNA